MAGVALGCVAVAAGLATAKVFMSSAAGEPVVFQDSSPVEVVLATLADRAPRAQLSVGPGDRLVFVMGHGRLDVLRLDERDAAMWVWTGDQTGIAVRLTTGESVAWVSPGSCPAVIAYDAEHPLRLRRVEPERTTWFR